MGPVEKIWKLYFYSRLITAGLEYMLSELWYVYWPINSGWVIPIL